MKKYSVCAIICAAGKGNRAGFEKNKLLVPYENETVLYKTLSAFDFPAIDEIVVTASAEDMPEVCAITSRFTRTNVTVGGTTRMQSVYNALKAAKSDIVLIHDGARPFVSREVIEGCIKSVIAFGSGICALPCTDTVACVKDGKIVDVPARETLRQIQTPQGFFRENILFAHERASASESERVFTDDSSVFAAYCGTPTICAGARENSKLTHAEDFRNAFARTGFGVDTHAFGKEQDYILLAGVKIPSKSGLIAHSDGDVVIHAVMDALLSAVGLRDIGFYFPDTDETYRNANSMELLQRVHGMLVEKNYKLLNLSVTILAEHPKLSPYIDCMKENLAHVLHSHPSQIGITAGTNEGLGYVGEGKGITVHAYALLNHK